MPQSSPVMPRTCLALPEEYLRRGSVSDRAQGLVQYVDDDAAGENRFVEFVPERPAARVA